MADDSQAGTPQVEPDDRDGAPEGAQAGTPGNDADGRDGGEEKVTMSAGELAAWKAKVEEANRLREHVSRLEAEQRARGQAPTPRAGSDDDDTVKRARNAVARLRQAAQEGNEDALAVVAIGEEARSFYERARIERELDKIPETEHDAVMAEMDRTGIRSPKVVYKLMRESKLPTLEAEVEKLRKENEELRRQKPAPARDTRPPAASKVQAESDAGKKMGLSDYNEAYRSGDPARIAAAKAARASGNVDLSR